MNDSFLDLGRYQQQISAVSLAACCGHVVVSRNNCGHGQFCPPQLVAWHLRHQDVFYPWQSVLMTPTSQHKALVTSRLQSEPSQAINAHAYTVLALKK